MQHNATHRDHHLSAQFQEMFAQGRDLRPGVVGPCQAKPHLLHQDIRSRGQQHPERVRQKVRATGAADLHAVVQFFNPVFHVAPLTVNRDASPVIPENHPLVDRGFFSSYEFALYPLVLVVICQVVAVLLSRLRAIDVLLVFISLILMSPLAYLIREARGHRPERRGGRRGGAERTPILPQNEEVE